MRFFMFPFVFGCAATLDYPADILGGPRPSSDAEPGYTSTVERDLDGRSTKWTVVSPDGATVVSDYEWVGPQEVLERTSRDGQPLSQSRMFLNAEGGWTRMEVDFKRDGTIDTIWEVRGDGSLTLTAYQPDGSVVVYQEAGSPVVQ